MSTAPALDARESCPFCTRAQTVYLSSPRWLVFRHADPVPLSGWMMIATREHRSGLDAMDEYEQRELGTVVAAVARAVREETGCERTYTISFNEAVRHLHIHIIPRHEGDSSTTSWALADRYRATARKERAGADPEDAERTAQAIAQRTLATLGSLGFSAP